MNFDKKTQEQIASLIFLDEVQKNPNMTASELRERLEKRGVVLLNNGKKL